MLAPRKISLAVMMSVALSVLLVSPGRAASAAEQEYRGTLYNNFIAMAFNETCQVLNASESQALLNNVNILARDFRDLFGYTREQWDGLIKQLEDRYETENLTCDNQRARDFAKSVARDIAALMR